MAPLYNEEEFVQMILNRVLEADLPDGMDRELIVVEDSSTDRSAKFVEEIVSEHPGVVRLMRRTE